MAATISIMGETGMRGRPIHMVKVDLDNSYPTGGYAITAHDVGFGHLDHMVVQSACKQGYIIEWDGLTACIKVRRVGSINSIMAEVPAGTDLSGISVDVMAVGAG